MRISKSTSMALGAVIAAAGMAIPAAAQSQDAYWYNDQNSSQNSSGYYDRFGNWHTYTDTRYAPQHDYADQYYDDGYEYYDYYGDQETWYDYDDQYADQHDNYYRDYDRQYDYNPYGVGSDVYDDKWDTGFWDMGEYDVDEYGRGNYDSNAYGVGSNVYNRSDTGLWDTSEYDTDEYYSDDWYDYAGDESDDGWFDW